MPTASVTGIKVNPPRHANREAFVAADELDVEFQVSVSHAGCYAIGVTVRDHDTFTPNEILLSNLARNRLPCICLQPGQAQSFRITAGGSVGAGPAAPTAAGGVIELPPLKGRWPSSDGPFDDTLELFAEVEVYSCHRACDPGGACGDILLRRLGPPVGSASSEDETVDVDIIDGTGGQEGLDLLKEAAKAGGSVARSAAPAAGSAVPGAAAGAEVAVARAVLERIDGLERKVRRLERASRAPEEGPSADARTSPGPKRRARGRRGG